MNDKTRSLSSVVLAICLFSLVEPVFASGSLFTDEGQKRFNQFVYSLRILLPSVLFFKSMVFLGLASRPGLLLMFGQAFGSLLICAIASALLFAFFNSFVFVDTFQRLLTFVCSLILVAIGSDAVVFVAKNRSKKKTLWLLLLGNTIFVMAGAAILYLRFIYVAIDAMQ